MDILERYCQLTGDRDDKLLFQARFKTCFHQSVNTATWAILANYPQLRVKSDRFIDRVDVLRFAILQLLKDCDLIDEILDSSVLLTLCEFQIGLVNVDDFDGN